MEPTHPSPLPEPPSISWTKAFDAGSRDLLVTALTQASDGGYAFACSIGGYANEYMTFNQEVILIKTDPYGNMQWNQTYQTLEKACGVVQTPDGEYILVGSNNGGPVILLKTDSKGVILWNQTYDGCLKASYRLDGMEARSIIHTNDGGYTIAGNMGVTYSPSGMSTDAFLIKTDLNGKLEWSNTYIQSGVNEFFSFVQTADGGYAAAGESTPCNGTEKTYFWLLKTDSFGNALWNRTYGLVDKNLSQACSIVETNDGGYALVGSAYRQGSDNSIWLVKTDSFGNIEWNQTWDGDVLSLIQTSDEGLAFVGSTRILVNSGSGIANISAGHLVKLSSSGGIQWNQTFYVQPVQFDSYSNPLETYVATRVIETSDGGLIWAVGKYSGGVYVSYMVKLESSMPPLTPSPKLTQSRPLSPSIPELPPWTILAFLSATMIVFVAFKKKLKHVQLDSIS